ncbi:substrate-binding domain-containing protein [Rhodobacter calidifons]|uniref:Phosphate ABC transporter substrate-binding protein n=1 Tax=Rhodobacter calidifons TaxID=2715277 RepID=A0ABX0GBV8_9RHOB|nr:substrate-binding domain-containing protein [Rhodobacter calidifons]NHB78412.1 phosphate ABC transporter substrate-binding protein [Rhodobacter calidifons]
MKSIHLTASVLAFAAATAMPAFARDQIRIVGSSTVFPYTQAVAEEFANHGGAAPVVESTGTGGGMQIFCGGVGADHPDLTGASRAMKKSEYELCVQNGVTDITEALIGYDGLAIAVNRKNETDWDLTLEQVYKALAAKVPVDGALVDNPYKKWSDIDPSLPDIAIIAYGPPPTSGTRDAFVELAMHKGCEATDYAKALKEAGDKDAYKKFVDEDCSRMRQDGPFIEAGENDNLIVQRLEADPNAVGIFGYSFLYENLDKLKDVKINGVEANQDTIASFEYPIARPLYFYVKNAHRGVIPGLNEFIMEYASKNALGAGGYLSERGLVVLAEDKLAEVQAALTNAVNMAPPEK